MTYHDLTLQTGASRQGQHRHFPGAGAHALAGERCEPWDTHGKWTTLRWRQRERTGRIPMSSSRRTKEKVRNALIVQSMFGVNPFTATYSNHFSGSSALLLLLQKCQCCFPFHSPDQRRTCCQSLGQNKTTVHNSYQFDCSLPLFRQHHTSKVVCFLFSLDFTSRWSEV